MTDWYYTTGRKPRGPLSDEALRAHIDAEQPHTDILVWREGMNTWQRADQRPELFETLAAPPPSPSEQTPSSSPGPEVPPAPPSQLAIPRPWPRFWARSADTMLLSPAVTFLLSVWAALYSPDLYLAFAAINTVLVGILVLPVISVILAIMMTLTGTTPGKALFGVHVLVPTQANRLGFFLRREFAVWTAGLALGIPLAKMVTQFRQFQRLEEGEAASYDEGHPPVFANPSGLRLASGVVIILALSVATAILKRVDAESERTLSTSQSWINPATSKAATIGATWQVEELEAESGWVFHFTSDVLLAEALFGLELLPPELTEVAAYADAFEEAISSHVTITSDWASVTVHDMPGLRARGKSVESPVSDVEVTVAVRGREAWRTLVFTRGRSSEQIAETEALVREMFSSAIP